MKSNVHILKHNTQLKALYTLIRDKNTERDDFVFFSERIIRLLVEHALSLLPVKSKVVMTCGQVVSRCCFQG